MDLEGEMSEIDKTDKNRQNRPKQAKTGQNRPKQLSS